MIENELIIRLSVGTVLSNLFYWFEIGLFLTQKGIEQYERVIEMFFSYLRFIQSKPIQTHLLEKELKDKEESNLSNRFETQPLKTLTNDISALHWCPTQNINFRELQFTIDDDKKNKRIYKSIST